MSPQLEFGKVAEGSVPERGDVTAAQNAGKNITSDVSIIASIEKLGQQVHQGRVDPTDLAVAAAKADAKGGFEASFTRATPPAGLAPKGDEDTVYKYDRAKNEDIGRVSFG